MRRNTHHQPRFQVLRWVGILLGFFLIAAALIRHFEAAHPESMIRDYDQALWYCLVTISTVGYGDYYPVSTGGRLVGGMVIIFALAFAGYTLGKIQSAVSERMTRRHLGMNGCDFTDHYVVFGWNASSRIVSHELLKAGKRVAILAADERQLTDIDNAFHAQRARVFRTYGDSGAEEILRRLRIDTAAAVILLNDDDTATLISSLNLRAQYPAVRIIAHIANPMLKETIATAGVTYVVSSHEIIGRMVASAAFEPEVGLILEDLLSGAEGEDDYDVQQYHVPAAARLVGATVGDLERRMRESDAGRLLAISTHTPDGRRIDKNPHPEQSITGGQILVIIVNARQARNFRSEILDVPQGGE
ncbi:MAG: ion channel [Bacteroidota bacterium]|jgi:voltage-gated potassium channel|nr:ion channel [Bacteroidota bacterium]